MSYIVRYLTNGTKSIYSVEDEFKDRIIYDHLEDIPYEYRDCAPSKPYYVNLQTAFAMGYVKELYPMFDEAKCTRASSSDGSCLFEDCQCPPLLGFTYCKFFRTKT